MIWRALCRLLGTFVDSISANNTYLMCGLHPLDLGALGDLLPPLEPLGASPSLKAQSPGAWPQESSGLAEAGGGCPQDGSSSTGWATKPGVPVLTVEERWREDKGLTPRDTQNAPLRAVGEFRDVGLL